MDAEALELARRMIVEVMGRGRTDLIAQLCAPDMILHDPIGGDLDVRGMEELVGALRRAFPDLDVRAHEVLAAGDEFVVVRWEASGTHRGEVFGLAPTGRWGSIDGISMVRLGAGLLQESWAQWDALGLLRQLGAFSQPHAFALPTPAPRRRTGAAALPPR